MVSLVYLLDYVAGNRCSLTNAIAKLGFQAKWISTAEEIRDAPILIFPGVGHFGHCLQHLKNSGLVAAVLLHINSGKPFMGICVGMQALFQASRESIGTEGLGIVAGTLQRFDSVDKSVPHVGWNTINQRVSSLQATDTMVNTLFGKSFYFVHSFAVPYLPGQLEDAGWAVATTVYGKERFISAISRRNVFATQFHPEKSGHAGLEVIETFLRHCKNLGANPELVADDLSKSEGLMRRIIACLDVRANDDGDLVVTKGDKYDVCEESSDGAKIRNLGKPVDMAKKYYMQGADEIIFLNIMSFRDRPLHESPMLDVLRLTAREVFVPLTVGGGISDLTDEHGNPMSALTVAGHYFRSGADKISIGSDAVYATEQYLKNKQIPQGLSSIETISAAYGNQAVIVSIDPVKVFVDHPDDTEHHTVQMLTPGPEGQHHCWYQCTVKGGREVRDIDAWQLAKTAEILGAGEILLNSIDKDGTSGGFDLELIDDIKSAVKIPVIASSGAGRPSHFAEVFGKTSADAALGAGMFHRGIYSVNDVKEALITDGYHIRN